MARIEKTVFISYRHKDIAWALLVYKFLSGKGYDAFFDFTSIPSGDFEQIIIGNIKARAHFLVILTPTTLDRCDEPGDWLRREIETAIEEKRNVIPLFFDGFKFGDPVISEKLSGKLGKLQKYNGINFPEGYFDEAMERLCARYLNVALDAVLHPVSAEVQKAVEEQKSAANQAVVEKQPNSKRNKIELRDIIKKIPTFEFLRVPAGKFVMGSPNNNQLVYETLYAGKDVLPPKYPEDEWPRHEVDIPYDYWISKFTVTNKQFALFTESHSRKHPIYNWEEEAQHPVREVSWNLAISYAKWLTTLFKKDIPSGLIFPPGANPRPP